MAQVPSQFKLKLLITAISALLLMVLGLTSAQVFWQAYSHFYAPSPFPVVSSKATVTLPSAVNYADAIGRGNIFGRPQATNDTSAQHMEAIPETSLKVNIRGILSLSKGSDSLAILSVENAADKVYKLGAELKFGYTVEKIVADGVVIDHNGRLEMIRLPRASLADINAGQDANTVNANSAVGLGALRAEVLRNPLALEQHIAFAPINKNGQFAGYQVNPGSKPNMFRKLGLQANDIVSSVDGVGIGQLAGRMDILTNLSVAKSLRLGIVRNGQEQQLLVDFSQ